MIMGPTFRMLKRNLQGELQKFFMILILDGYLSRTISSKTLTIVKVNFVENEIVTHTLRSVSIKIKEHTCHKRVLDQFDTYARSAVTNNATFETRYGSSSFDRS